MATAKDAGKTTQGQERERPDFCTDEMLNYLDELRESGVTNMFGAVPYVEEAFGLKRDHATEVLSYWMGTFSKRHPKPKMKTQRGITGIEILLIAFVACLVVDMVSKAL